MNLFENNDKRVLSVGEFLTTARQTLENNLPPLWVSGEITNFTRAVSGHWYFVLRDAEGQVDCMMLGRFNTLSVAPPSEGAAMEVMAQPSLYTPRGRFQLMVQFMRPAGGTGKWYQTFVERKKAWAARGWFNSERKRTLPFWPATIGVVGSITGAALQDVMRTINTRLPAINIIIYPAPAQGADAAEKIATAIRTAGQRAECAVLIVCRGGGGIEDLWAYNEETVVAAIVNSPIPIVTGIGHETDETLADFAADIRAATPTGAAVLTTPDGKALRERLQSASVVFYRQMQRLINEREQQLDWATTAIIRPTIFLNQKYAAWQRLTAFFKAAVMRCEVNSWHRFKTATSVVRQSNFEKQTSTLAALSRRLFFAVKCGSANAERRLFHCQQTLAMLHPQRTLKRGYSMVQDTRGIVVSDSTDLRPADILTITFSCGRVQAAVLADEEKKRTKQMHSQKMEQVE